MNFNFDWTVNPVEIIVPSILSIVAIAISMNMQRRQTKIDLLKLRLQYLHTISNIIKFFEFFLVYVKPPLDDIQSDKEEIYYDECIQKCIIEIIKILRDRFNMHVAKIKFSNKCSSQEATNNGVSLSDLEEKLLFGKFLFKSLENAPRYNENVYKLSEIFTEILNSLYVGDNSYKFFLKKYNYIDNKIKEYIDILREYKQKIEEEIKF